MNNAKDIVIAVKNGDVALKARVNWDPATLETSKTRVIERAFKESGSRRPDSPAWSWKTVNVIVEGARLPKSCGSQLVIDELEKNKLDLATAVATIHGRPCPLGMVIRQVPTYSMMWISGHIGKIRLRNLPVRVEGRTGRAVTLVAIGGFSVLDD